MDETETNNPHYMKGTRKTICSHFYLNGNEHFEGKKILINQKAHKTWDSILDHLTISLKPSFGAVRALYTPSHGHRVHHIDDFRPEAKYVAGGYGPFRSFRYTDIESRPRRPPRVKTDDSVHFNTPARFRQIAGRHRNIRVEGKNILIHINGDTVNPPRLVSLSPRDQQSWDMILKAIYLKIQFQIQWPLRRIFTTQGEPILDPGDLHPNCPYVAVMDKQEFISCKYGMGLPPLRMSPRLDIRLPPLKRAYKSSQGTPESSVASNTDTVNTYGSRGRRVTGQGNSYFHAKPVKHKRTPPDQAQRKINFDKDQDSVFKAKKPNRNTVGAREIEETRDTKVDIPIDQVEAEEVQTENIEQKDDNTKTEEKSTVKSPPLSPTQSADDRTRDRAEEKRQENEAATKIQANYRGFKARQDVKALKKANDAKKQEREATLGEDNKLSAEQQKQQQEKENEAATKIQANYRGFATRKQLAENKKAQN